MTRLWLLGFAIFFSSNIIGSFVQIAALPVVILAPLGAVSLLWNAFFARLILGDVFSPWMILGTILIAGGAVLIAIFGIVPEPTRSLEDLLELFRRPAFAVYFSILMFIVVVSLAAVGEARSFNVNIIMLIASIDTYLGVCSLKKASSEPRMGHIRIHDPALPNHKPLLSRSTKTGTDSYSSGREHSLTNDSQSEWFGHGPCLNHRRKATRSSRSKACPHCHLLCLVFRHPLRNVPHLRQERCSTPHPYHGRPESILEMGIVGASTWSRSVCAPATLVLAQSTHLG